MEILARCEDVEWDDDPIGAEAFAYEVLKGPLAELAPPAAEVSVLFTNDARIHLLNRLYREKDTPTDVLSFAFMDEGENPEGAGVILGDIVVSLETARRQAVDRGVESRDEIALLLLHGLLHLLGYDHEDAEGEIEMFDIQKSWLEQLGFAPMGEA